MADPATLSPVIEGGPSSKVIKEGEVIALSKVTKEGEAIDLSNVSNEGEGEVIAFPRVIKEGEVTASPKVIKEGEAIRCSKVIKEEVIPSSSDNEDEYELNPLSVLEARFKEEPEDDYDGEDEPFALCPEGYDGYVPSHGLICLFCLETAKPWKRSKDDPTSYVTSLGRLLSLKEGKGRLLCEANYCRNCQNDVILASNLFGELDVLQQKIEHLKGKIIKNLETDGNGSELQEEVGIVRAKILKGIPGRNTSIYTGKKRGRKRKNVDVNLSEKAANSRKRFSKNSEGNKRKGNRDSSPPIGVDDIDSIDGVVVEDAPNLPESKRTRRITSLKEPANEAPSGNDDETSEKTEKTIEKKRYSCPICGYKRDTEDLIAAHVRRAHEKNPRPYLCPEPSCGKAFAHTNQLRAHTLRHAGAQLPYQCDICGKTFPYRENLHSHQINRHPDAPSVAAKMEESVKKGLKCKECGKIFANKGTLDSHSAYHTKQFPCVCELCGKGFVSQSTLESHKIGKHGGGHKCTFEGCERTFPSKQGLKDHLCTHTGTYKVVCDVCGYGTHNSHYLKRHKMTHVGTEMGVLKCTVCEKTFTNPLTLKRHRDTHDGIYDKRCQFCGKGFSTQVGWKKHIRIYHSNNEGGNKSLGRGKSATATDQPSQPKEIHSPNLNQS